jgi:hypothetical protein
MMAATPTKTRGRMIHGGGPDVRSDVNRKFEDADDEQGEHDREVHRIAVGAPGPQEADADAEE